MFILLQGTLNPKLVSDIALMRLKGLIQEKPSFIQMVPRLVMVKRVLEQVMVFTGATMTLEI